MTEGQIVEAAEPLVSKPFDLVLALWIEKRFGVPAATISSPTLDLQPGGSCGNDTCWFDDEARVAWFDVDEDGDSHLRNETLHLAPGDVIEELAALDLLRQRAS